MPTIGPGTGQSSQAYLRNRRRRRKPPAPPRPVRAYPTGGDVRLRTQAPAVRRNTQRVARQQRARARQQFRSPVPSLPSYPGQRKTRRLERRQEHAERRARGGSIPRPWIPALRHPTRAQRAAAIRLGARSNAAARRRGITPAELARARKFDPQVRQRDAVIRAYQQRAVADVYRQLARQTPIRRTGGQPVNVAQLTRGSQERIGEAIARGIRARVKPGPAHSILQAKVVGLGPVGPRIDATAIHKAVAARLATVAYGHGAPLVKGPLRNAVSDAVNMPAGAVKGIYEMGAAAVEAAHGDTRRAKQIAKGFTQGAAGRLVQGDVKGAVREIEAHPLYSAMDFAGLYGAAGRIGGAAARAGLAGARARRFAQLGRREAVAFRGQEVGTARRYSKNIITQAAQRRRDARLPVDRRGRVIVPESMLPLRGRSHHLERSVDEFASTQNARLNLERDRIVRGAAERTPVRRGKNVRGVRGRVIRAADRAVGRPQVTIRGRKLTRRPERDVPRLIAEGEVRFNPRSRDPRLRDPRVIIGDLQRIRAAIDAEYRNPDTRAAMSREARETNRANVAALDAALRHPEVLIDHADELWRVAQAIKHEAGKTTRTLIELKALDPRQAERASRMPYLVRHEGARSVKGKLLESDVEAHAAARAIAQRAGERARKAREATARARDRAVAAQERARMDRTRLGPVESAARRRPDEVTWYHGTSADFPGLPSALRGQTRRGATDLGTWLTSDPAYASRYAEARVGAQGGAGRVVMARVQVKPERVLDLTAGDPRLLNVIQRLQDQVGATTPDIARARRLAMAGRLSEQDANALHMALLRIGGRIEGGEGPVAGGPVRAALLREGVDAIRKPTHGADSLVVLNERVMRSPHFRHEEARAAREAVGQARLERRAAQKAATQARQAVQQARPKPHTGLTIGGRRVSTEQARDIMRAAGVDDPAFLTQAPGTRGARAYFRSAIGGRKSAETQGRRTGRSTLLGAHPYGEQGVTESLLHARILAMTIQSFDRFVEQFAVKGPSGIRLTPKEAQRLVDSLDAEAMPEMAAVRFAPARAGDSTLQAIADLQGSGNLPPLNEVMERVYADRALELHQLPTETQNVALVPRAALERWQAHELDRAADLQKAGQAITGAFRKTVLPFSLKWLFGNVAEATVRSAAAGIAPIRDVRIARRLMHQLREVDDESADLFLARTQGGLLFGAPTRSVYREASMFKGSNWRKVGAPLGAFGRLPVVREVLAGLDVYQRGIFAVNKGVERLFQQGVIGKAARQEIQDLTGSWVKSIRASDAALADVARGLTGTPAQVKFARTLDETLGKYSRFSPTTRKITQGLAPFLPWYLNAWRFVYHTLPVKHPVKAAVLTNVERTFEQDWQAQIDRTGSQGIIDEGDLRSALILPDGGLLPLARYTPFGAMTDLPAGFTDPLLPQFMSVYNIANNRNFAGRELQQPSGDPVPKDKRVVMAMYAALEALVPGIAIARRAMERGGTSYDTSTIFAPQSKPGTARKSPLDIPGIPAAANRVLNPLRPTYLRRGPTITTSGGGGRGPRLDPIDRALLRTARPSRAEEAAERRVDDALLKALGK